MNHLLFIEATTPDGYKVLWRQPESATVDDAILEALQTLATLQTPYRLELWSKAHAESPKGFCPMAFRDANETQCHVSNTLKMLMGLPT